MTSVIGPETVSMTTRDGVRLDADLYRPAEGGPWPVLLMRQPYGRRIASTVVFAHPRWYAARGYMVVVQDVRGMGTSEGVFEAFATEREDGAETVAWAAALPGSTGRVGMYGFSYQGMTQFLALAGGAPALAALAPVMAAWDLRDDWAYEGDALRLADGIGWGVQMAALRAAHDGDAPALAALTAAARNPPLHDATPAFPEILRRTRDLGHYAGWVENEAPGAYWDRVAPRAALAGQRMDVPMLHLGGWYDTMLMGTIASHAAASAATDRPQHLVIGPWPHLPWGRISGAVDLGAEAAPQIDRLQLRWFDRFLKDAPGAEDLAGLALFDLTLKRWHHLPVWPTGSRALSLASDGLAAASVIGGRLDPAPGEAASDEVVHDPWRPVPSLGGHDAAPMGRADRTALDARADIACFTSAPFAETAFLAGSVDLDLWITADAPSFDISAVLSEITPEGRAIVLTQGYRRVAPGVALPVRVSLRAVCATIRPGTALRLSLAGASFPAHPVNTGTGGPIAEARATEARVVTLSIAHGGETASRLVLPWNDAID